MSEAERRPRRRIRSAWAVLMGQQVTPQQQRADFVDMQIAFDSIFDKLNTALSRLVKREQARAEELAKLLEGAAPPASAPDTGGLRPDKAALYRRAAELGLTGFQAAARREPLPKPLRPPVPVEEGKNGVSAT